MNAAEYQQWLCAHGQPVAVDGNPGPQTRAATLAAFTNPAAPAVTEAELAGFALRLGCTARQLRAVAMVESGGAAYDRRGRPKILFERHLFFRLTAGRYGVTTYSNAAGGGYGEDSWEKLTQAACKDVAAAFGSASWGKFQILGLHWGPLGYPSALELAYSTVAGEAAHYDLLCHFIEANGLKDELARLSADPVTCRDFARHYNGPGYRAFGYDTKLARAMAS